MAFRNPLFIHSIKIHYEDPSHNNLRNAIGIPSNIVENLCGYIKSTIEITAPKATHRIPEK